MYAFKAKRARNIRSWTISCSRPVTTLETPVLCGPLSTFYTATSSQLPANSLVGSLALRTGNYGFMMLRKQKVQRFTLSITKKRPTSDHLKLVILTVLSFDSSFLKAIRQPVFKRHCRWSGTLLGSSPTNVF